MGLHIESFKVQNVHPTAYYIPEYISPSEERAILENVYSAPKPKWTQLSNRRLQNWGGIPHARGMVAERVPGWLQRQLARVGALPDLWRAGAPNHALVNEYRPGQGILPHLDGELFHPTIATVSLGSHTVLRFAAGPPRVSTALAPAPAPASALMLEPRSLLLLRDSLYTDYMHYIEEIEEDTLDDSIANLNLCSNQFVKGSTIRRDTRISLTIRHVPKTTTFKINIGNNR